MKILVAGDSFAVSYPMSEYSWSDQLQKIFNCEITNIAYPATSLAWTYKQLNKQRWTTVIHKIHKKIKQNSCMCFKFR